MIVLNLHTCASKTVNDTISESSSADVYRSSNESLRFYSSSANKSDGDDLHYAEVSEIDNDYDAAIKLLEKNNHIINTTIHYDEIVEPKEDPKKSRLNTMFSNKHSTSEVQEKYDNTLEEATDNNSSLESANETNKDEDTAPAITTSSKYVCTVKDGVEICNPVEEIAEADDTIDNDASTNIDIDLEVIDEQDDTKLGFFGKLKEFFKRLIEKIKKIFHKE